MRSREKGDFSSSQEAMRQGRLDAVPRDFAARVQPAASRRAGDRQTARNGCTAGASHAGQAGTLAQWLEVSPHWLPLRRARSGRIRRKAGYRDLRVDSAWLGKKFDSLSEPHRKMVLENQRALLRLEGKQ